MNAFEVREALILLVLNVVGAITSLNTVKMVPQSF